jgi:hypothetical protein
LQGLPAIEHNAAAAELLEQLSPQVPQLESAAEVDAEPVEEIPATQEIPAIQAQEILNELHPGTPEGSAQ